jgi:hypothetical protein
VLLLTIHELLIVVSLFNIEIPETFNELSLVVSFNSDNPETLKVDKQLCHLMLNYMMNIIHTRTTHNVTHYI